MEQSDIKPMVDYIGEVIGRVAAIKGDNYVYLDTKEVIGDDIIEEANALKENDIKNISNNEIMSQITAKEQEQSRPIRELKTTTSTDAEKEYAQSKIDALDSEIRELRSQLI